LQPGTVSHEIGVNGIEMTETLSPNLYERWRATSLGALTEQLESRLVFELIGPLVGKRVLDVGTGDGA